MILRAFSLGFALLLSVGGLFAQVTSTNPTGQQGTRVVTSTVPFLTLSPDARHAAMGDAGVATSADASSIHWNSAQLPWIKDDIGFSVSYTPWLRKLVDDMSLSYLSGYKKISQEQTIGASLRYFDLGSIEFTDETGASLGDFRPKEFAFDVAYGRKLSEHLSVGLALRFIHSNLTGGVSIGGAGGQATKPGNAAAGDIGVYYTNEAVIDGRPLQWSWGATITNLGNKISYTTSDQADFIPTNLRIGTAATYEVDLDNKVTFALDFNKLMVPTPPITDSSGTIVSGQDPNRPLLSGIFGSFGDAPDGFSEELQEVIVNAGIEYWYKDLLAARAGYFYENNNKGGRQYFTVGAGVRYNTFGLDLAYLIPTRQNHPLAETLRFTLLFNFAQNKEVESLRGE